MNLDILKYRNLFPSDINESAGFLLKIMALLPPIHENAIKMILKPLICDDNVRGTLYFLEDKKYIWKRHTAMGNFYAITSKTEKALDIDYEKSAHRKQEINLKPLYTNYLKGHIAATAILKCGAASYLKHWKMLEESEQEVYLRKCGIERRNLEWNISQINCKTIDLLPRSIVDTNSVLSEMADGILNGKVPFTAPYSKKIYKNTDYDLLKSASVYDTARIAISQRSACYTKDGSCKLTEGEYSDLLTVRNQYEAARRNCEVITYYNGIKPMSLSVLEDNGIFIVAINDEEIHFGILDNARYGLSLEVLNTRFDYCISFAEHLKMKYKFSIYCISESLKITQRRIEKCKILKRIINPSIEWIEVEEKRPPLKAETWKSTVLEV